MALAHPLKNTKKDYKCTQCASDNVSIIREDAVDPRLKCNSCQFMFNGQDSLAAIEAGAIKPSSPETLAEAGDPEVIPISTKELAIKAAATSSSYIPLTDATLAPSRPSHLFLAKNRVNYELCSKRAFKTTAVRWSQGDAFDVYELKRIKLNVKVDIST